ncbi:MAG: hypothetical protein P1U85_00965 [Verrucomicrobiales bacterium]|nr:hypothetical protein [Verrucomicrobiales bacterium]
MKKTLFAILGLAILSPCGSEAQDSTAAVPPGYGIQSSAARNKKLREQEMQAAVQRAREMKALQYSTAAQPMAPIPWVPEPDPEPPPTSATPSVSPSYGPVPQAPRPPSSPNPEAVEQALRASTNQGSVELPSSNQKSGSLFSKLLGKKDEPAPMAPTGASSYQNPAPSPYESASVEMTPRPPAPQPQAPPAPSVSSPPPSGGSIFVNRGGSSSGGSSGKIKYEVDVDVNGVDVVLPRGSQVSILEEQDGFARIRIPDGRVGIVDREAID